MKIALQNVRDLKLMSNPWVVAHAAANKSIRNSALYWSHSRFVLEKVWRKYDDLFGVFFVKNRGYFPPVLQVWGFQRRLMVLI